MPPKPTDLPAVNFPNVEQTHLDRKSQTSHGPGAMASIGKHGTDARVRQDSSDGIISVGLSRWLGKAGTVDAAG